MEKIQNFWAEIDIANNKLQQKDLIIEDLELKIKKTPFQKLKQDFDEILMHNSTL